MNFQMFFFLKVELPDKKKNSHSKITVIQLYLYSPILEFIMQIRCQVLQQATINIVNQSIQIPHIIGQQELFHEKRLQWWGLWKQI